MNSCSPLIRNPGLLLRLSVSNSTAYRWIADGLLPQPIRLGRNSVAWLVAEIDAVIAARTAGASDAEVRELVASLHAARKSASTAAA